MGCCVSKKSAIVDNNKSSSNNKNAPIIKDVTMSPIIKTTRNNSEEKENEQIKSNQHANSNKLIDPHNKIVREGNYNQNADLITSQYDLSPVTVSNPTLLTPNGNKTQQEWSQHDDFNLDNDTVSMTSSQARNLGPLIAARMKRVGQNSLMKKTVGTTRDMAYKTTARSSVRRSINNSFSGPENRAGYMFKQGKNFKQFKKAYFLLSNGTLLSFETEMDSINNSKLDKAKDKAIHLVGYKFSILPSKYQIVLEMSPELAEHLTTTTSPMNSPLNSPQSKRQISESNLSNKSGSEFSTSPRVVQLQRRQYIFQVPDQTQFLLWKKSFEEHIKFANQRHSDISVATNLVTQSLSISSHNSGKKI